MGKAQGVADPVEDSGVIEGNIEEKTSVSHVPEFVNLEEAEKEAREGTPPDEPAQDDVEGRTKEESEPESKPEVKPKPEKDKVQAHINQITREKYEYKQEAERLRAKLKAREEKLAKIESEKTLTEIEISKPKEDDFEEYEDYIVALGEWGARKELAKSRQVSQDTPPPSEEEKITDDERVERMFTKGREKYDDFEAVVLNEYLPLTQEMFDTIKESEVSPDLLYYIASNPGTAAQISRLTPLAAAKAIGRIEADLVRDQEKKKPTNAPEPIRPISGNTATVPKDPAKMTNAEYRAYRGYTKDGHRKE